VPRPPTDDDIAALSKYIECGTIRSAALALGVQPATLDARLVRIHEKVGVSTTPQAIYLLAARIEEHRRERP